MDISKTTSLRLAVVAFFLVVVNRYADMSGWAEAQYLLTYDFGFQRRALVGEVVSWFAPNGLTTGQINGIGAFATIAAAGALLVWMAKMLLPVRGGGAVLLMFVTSLGFETLIGNTGYLASYMILVMLLAVSMPMTVVGIVLRMALCGLGVLVHEVMLPVFASLIAAETYLRASTLPSAQRMAVSALPLLAGGLAAACVVVLGTHPYEVLPALQDAAQSRALDFKLYASAVEPVAAAGPEGRSYDETWDGLFYTYRLLAYVGVGGAFLVAQSVLTWQLTRGLPVLERVVAIAAGWAPMSLLFVAFDVSRFVAFALVNSLLMIGVLCQYRASCRDKLHEVFSGPVVLIFILLSGQMMLFHLNEVAQYKLTFPGNIVDRMLED